MADDHGALAVVDKVVSDAAHEKALQAALGVRGNGDGRRLQVVSFLLDAGPDGVGVHLSLRAHRKAYGSVVGGRAQGRHAHAPRAHARVSQTHAWQVEPCAPTRLHDPHDRRRQALAVRQLGQKSAGNKLLHKRLVRLGRLRRHKVDRRRAWAVGAVYGCR